MEIKKKEKVKERVKYLQNKIKATQKEGIKNKKQKNIDK